MNIIDAFAIKRPEDNIIAKRAALIKERKEISRRVDDYLQEIVCYYCDKLRFIDNDLCYGQMMDRTFTLTQQEKEELKKMLDDNISSLPEKLKRQIEEILRPQSDDKEETGDDTAKIEVKTVTVDPTAVAPTPRPSCFGY